MGPNEVTPATGWRCPGCGACYAPAVARCPACGPAPSATRPPDAGTGRRCGCGSTYAGAGPCPACGQRAVLRYGGT